MICWACDGTGFREVGIILFDCEGCNGTGIIEDEEPEKGEK